MKFAPCDKHTGMTGLSCMRLRHDDGRPATDAEVWAELERLRADQAECDALRERMADILSRTAVALRGPEPPLARWSWHDLPERAAAAIAAIDVMQRAAQQAAGSEAPNARAVAQPTAPQE